MGFKGLFEGWHIVIIVLLVVIVFGWKRLPDAARSLGRSARILKSEIGEMGDDGKSDAAGKTVPGETVPPQQAGAVPGEAPVQQQTYQQPPAAAPQYPTQPNPQYPTQPNPQQYAPPQQPTGTNNDRGTGV